MRKGLIIFLIILAVLAIAFVGIMHLLKWDFNKLSTVEYVTNTHETIDNFKNISILTDVADITLIKGEKTFVECYEIKNLTHNVSVENDTLKIQVQDNRKWYEHIGVFLGAPKITVYLTENEYEALMIESDTGSTNLPKDFTFNTINIKSDTGKIILGAKAKNIIKLKTDTGHIVADGISAKNIEITTATGSQKITNAAIAEEIETGASTGKVVLENVTCKSIESIGDTGSLTLKNVIAAENFDLERSTGNITLERSDAAEIFIDTDTGNIKGTILSNKIFLTESETGKIDVTKSDTGGRCEISTDTGNIKIEIVE